MKLSKEMSLEESFAAHGGKVAAVRCSKCDKCAAFDALVDIKYRDAVLLGDNRGVSKRGYVTCPWCGNEMIVSELNDAGLMIGKYYTVLEGDGEGHVIV